jgi:hypothetical protein
MNVCENIEYLNLKDREESSTQSIESMFLPDEQPFEEGGGKRCGDTPIQPTTIICSSGWGCLVVLEAISNTGRTAQLKRGVSVRQRLRRRYACRYVRWSCMCVVCCSENCARVWLTCTVSRETQSHCARRHAAGASELHVVRIVRRCVMRCIQELVQSAHI